MIVFYVNRTAIWCSDTDHVDRVKMHRADNSVTIDGTTYQVQHQIRHNDGSLDFHLFPAKVAAA